jgi:hypothetical protein
MSYLPELRASLVRAAERERAAGAAGAPSPRSRRGWFAWLGPAVAVGVAIAVVVVAIVLVGHGRPAGPAPTGPAPAGHRLPATFPRIPAPPPQPNPSPAQWSLIQKAQNTTSARDAMCSPYLRLPAYNQGSPSSLMVSLLGVLGRARTADDEFPLGQFRHGLPPDLYVNGIRLARAQEGELLYILPSANLGIGPVPARCLGEERAALERQMKGSSRAAVRAAVEAQRRFLIWQQYRASLPEQVCLAEIDGKDSSGGRPGAGGIGCGWGLADIERGLAGLGSRGPGSLFHGIVPDSVSSVTVEFPRGQGTASVRPINNVYLVRLPSGVSAPARIVWRSASGAVIRTTRVP